MDRFEQYRRAFQWAFPKANEETRICYRGFGDTKNMIFEHSGGDLWCWLTNMCEFDEENNRIIIKPYIELDGEKAAHAISINQGIEHAWKWIKHHVSDPKLKRDFIKHMQGVKKGDPFNFGPYPKIKKIKLFKGKQSKKSLLDYKIKDKVYDKTMFKCYKILNEINKSI